MKINILITSICIGLFSGCASLGVDNTRYPCAIGCGNENITPPKGYVYYGKKLMSLQEFNKMSGQNVVIEYGKHNFVSMHTK